MWWDKKVEAPTSEPKFQLVDLQVQVFKRWDWIVVQKSEVKNEQE